MKNRGWPQNECNVQINRTKLTATLRGNESNDRHSFNFKRGLGAALWTYHPFVGFILCLAIGRFARRRL